MSRGNKDDVGKPRFDLIDPEFHLEVAEVLTEGAKKYGDYNWTKVERDRYIAAAHRHLNALHRGETHDEESGNSHASHLACNAMFIFWLDKE